MRRLSTAKDWRTERGRTDGSEPSEQSKSFWDGVTSIADVQKSSRTNFSVDNKLPHRARDVTRHEKPSAAERWIIYPTDGWKFAWDCLCCTAVLYAVAEIPFTIGFLSDVPSSLAATVLDDILVAIFGIEIILSFNSAYVDTLSGLLITDRRKIAIRYSKFWLWLDLASMLPVKQIGTSFSDASEKDLNTFQLLRLFRLTRLAFVYKLMMSRRLSSFMDHINFSPQLKNVTLLFLQIFLTGHVLCCFWFFITTSACTGVSNPEDDSLHFLIRTWAVEFGYQNRSIYDQYVGSLYWTFSTLFTVGYGDIHATNLGERIFAILIMLLGSVLFGAVLAKIKDVLDSTNIQKNEIVAKMEEFNEYMYEKNFPSTLKFRAKEAYLYYLIRRPSLSERGLFDILPRALKIKVLTLKYRKEIMGIDIFHNGDPAFVVELLLHSRPYFMRPGEVIYGIGDVADELTFILRGSVRIDIPSRESKKKKTHNTAGFATTGWFFGDFEYVKQTPRIADYTAGQSCTLLSISYATVSEAIKNCPIAGAAFMSMLSDRLSLFKVQLKKESPFFPSEEPINSVPISIPGPVPLKRVSTSGVVDHIPAPPSPVPESSRRRSLSHTRCRANSIIGASYVTESIWVDGSFKRAEHLEEEIAANGTSGIGANAKYMVVKEVRIKNGPSDLVVVEIKSKDLIASGILYPKEIYKLVWDAFIASLILYAALTQPLQAAFDAFNEGPNFFGLQVMDYLVNGFFLLDMIVTLNTAYYSEKYDAYVTVRSMIFFKYLNNYFFVDLISSIPFDIIAKEALLARSSSDLSSVQLIKTVRLIRLIKLLKLAEIRKQLNLLIESMPVNAALVAVCYTVMTVAIIGHFLACVWWGVASSISDDPWFAHCYPNDTDLTLSPFRVQYVAALYLAVTTLTSTGFGDISPSNVEEQMLAIFIFIFGAIAYGYVTANIVTIIGNIGRNDARSDRFTHQIREYLDSDEISSTFLREVIRHAKNVLQRSSVFNEELILGRLPLHLRIEIFLYENREVLAFLAPFRFIKNNTVKLEILGAMRSNYADKGRCILKEGEQGGGIVFLVRGSAVVSRMKKILKMRIPRRSTLTRCKSSNQLLPKPKQKQSGLININRDLSSFFKGKKSIGSREENSSRDSLKSVFPTVSASSPQTSSIFLGSASLSPMSPNRKKSREESGKKGVPREGDGRDKEEGAGVGESGEACRGSGGGVDKGPSHRFRHFFTAQSSVQCLPSDTDLQTRRTRLMGGSSGSGSGILIERDSSLSLSPPISLSNMDISIALSEAPTRQNAQSENPNDPTVSTNSSQSPISSEIGVNDHRVKVESMSERDTPITHRTDLISSFFIKTKKPFSEDIEAVGTDIKPALSSDNISVSRAKTFLNRYRVFGSDRQSQGSIGEGKQKAGDDAELQEVMGVLSRGDFIGHKEMQYMIKHPSSLTAIEACQYYTFDHSDVLSLVRHQPMVAFEFQRALGLAVDDMDGRMKITQTQQQRGEFFSEIKNQFQKTKTVAIQRKGFAKLLLEYAKKKQKEKETAKRKDEKFNFLSDKSGEKFCRSESFDSKSSSDSKFSAPAGSPKKEKSSPRKRRGGTVAQRRAAEESVYDHDAEDGKGWSNPLYFLSGRRSKDRSVDNDTSSVTSKRLTSLDTTSGSLRGASATLSLNKKVAKLNRFHAGLCDMHGQELPRADSDSPTKRPGMGMRLTSMSVLGEEDRKWTEGYTRRSFLSLTTTSKANPSPNSSAKELLEAESAGPGSGPSPSRRESVSYYRALRERLGRQLRFNRRLGNEASTGASGTSHSNTDTRSQVHPQEGEDRNKKESSRSHGRLDENHGSLRAHRSTTDILNISHSKSTAANQGDDAVFGSSGQVSVLKRAISNPNL